MKSRRLGDREAGKKRFRFQVFPSGLCLWHVDFANGSHVSRLIPDSISFSVPISCGQLVEAFITIGQGLPRPKVRGETLRITAAC